MNTRKIIVIAVLMLGFLKANAQKEVDFPQLEKISPWSVSLEGSVYQKGFLTNIRYIGDNENIVYCPEGSSAILGGIGVDYTFNRANKLSYVLSAGLDLKPVLYINESEKGLDVTRMSESSLFKEICYSPFIAFTVQYRNIIANNEKWFYNLKGGMRFSYYDGYTNAGYSTTNPITQDSMLFSVNGYDKKYNLFPNLMFSIGTSYSSSIGMFGLNLIANISIPYLNESDIWFKFKESEFYGKYYLTGNYIGLTLTYSPKR
ncbi:MAG: hypothetical protein II298_06055 [Bacteroidales bacterium]|nr:hypothetical protein [Bacteroidales bacterium]MBQ5872753.1 hypothetical protein [Bacteroidales bacterium]